MLSDLIRACPGLGALVLAACFVDSGTASSSAPSGTDAPSTSTSAADTGDVPTTTSSLATSSSTTTTATPSSTDPPTTTSSPVCALAGGGCGDATPCCGCLQCKDGACIQPGNTCPTCSACSDDGACDPVAPGTGCAPPDTCSGLAFGIMDGACYAYAPQTGLCGDEGTCIPDPCSTFGAQHIGCPACLRDDNGCTPGAPLADLAVADVCHTTGTTLDCNAVCIDGGEAKLVQFACGTGGACEAVDEQLCAPYGCDTETLGCKTNCTADSDCSGGHTCNGFGQCVGP